MAAMRQPATNAQAEGPRRPTSGRSSHSSGCHRFQVSRTKPPSQTKASRCHSAPSRSCHTSGQRFSTQRADSDSEEKSPAAAAGRFRTAKATEPRGTTGRGTNRKDVCDPLLERPGEEHRLTLPSLALAPPARWGVRLALSFSFLTLCPPAPWGFEVFFEGFDRSFFFLSGSVYLGSALKAPC